MKTKQDKPENQLPNETQAMVKKVGRIAATAIGVVLGVILFFLAIFIAFPISGININSTNFQLVTNTETVYLRVKQQVYRFEYHYGQEYVDRKEFRISAQQETTTAVDASTLEQNREAIIGRLNYLGINLYDVTVDQTNQEIVVTVPAWVMREEIEEYFTNKGLITAIVMPETPSALESTPLDSTAVDSTETPPVASPKFVSFEYGWVKQATVKQGLHPYTQQPIIIVTMEFSDPKFMATQLSITDVQSATFYLGNSLIRSGSDQGSILSDSLSLINEKSPSTAALDTPYELKSLTFWLDAQEFSKVPTFLNNQLTTDLFVSTETSLPELDWNLKLILLIPLYAIVIVGIVLIYFRQHLWLIPFAVTHMVAIIFTAALLKLNQLPLDSTLFLGAALPVGIYSLLFAKIAVGSYQKTKEGVTRSIAMRAIWKSQYLWAAELLGILLGVAIITKLAPITLAGNIFNYIGLITIPYFLSVIFTLPLFLSQIATTTEQ